MAELNTFAIRVDNVENDSNHPPTLSMHPIGAESGSIDDYDVTVRNPDVNTALLRRLSLVESDSKDNRFAFRRQIWFKILISTTCITSVVSVCLNTPKMFKDYPVLLSVTLGLDLAVACILTAESLIKIAEKGFLVPKKAYLRSPGRVFEIIMVTFTWLSIFFQVLEVANVISPTKSSWYHVVSGLRCPRPMLLFRVGKNLLHIGIPKNVSRKPLRQIRNVCLFTVYAITVASIIGVQAFGPLSGYCIKSTRNDSNFSFSDFMIPVSRCNIHSKSRGYKCPENFTCQDTKYMTKWTLQTYFIHTGVGLLTVYEAQTQEGWTKVMYETIDSSSDLGAVIYFIILIMFVAWLTKNIFIAIVTEVFADLRSQVHNLYNVPKSNLSKDSSKVLMYHKSETGLQLIQGDQFEKEAGCRLTFKTVVRSYIFTWFFVSCILVDALLQGVLDTGDRITSQIIFTVLFDIEVLIKITAFGAKVYFENVPHRFECLLAVGSTVFLIPLRLKYENYGPYALFNVMRPFRLVLAWPSLAYFLKRILGGGKKLGSLLLFTGIFIVVASGVSLQLFCNMKPGSGDLFETFPSAAKVMFQVLMQEAWNEVLHEMIRKSDNNYSALVFIYFILYHMFAAVILISVFVALILDNLEFDEEVKIMKQHHIKEVTDINYKMPLRLQIFQKMKARPKIVRTENIGCSIPKVRDSFMSHYLRDVTDDNVLYDTNITSKVNDVQPGDLGVNLISIQADIASIYPNKQLRKQSSVSALINMSHHRKCILDGSANPLNPRIHHGRRGSTIRRRRFSHPHSFGGSLIQKANQGQNLDGGALPRRNILPYRFQLNSASDGKTEKNLDTVRQRLREAQRSKEAKLSDLRENFPYFDKSIFLLPYDNKIRKIFRHIVHARYVAFSESSEQRLFGAFSLNRFKKYLGSQTYLDWIMMLLTHISCWALLFETPEYRAFQYPPTKYIEYIFVVTTTLEIGLKSLADGFFLTPTALLKDFGGVLHFFIYIVALVHVCWHPQSIKPNSFAQMLLILRALRPLRIITLAPPLRNVVQIFVRGYKDILKVAILQLLLMFVFAIYGVQMFRNRLGYCTDSNLTTKRDCNGTCTVALSSPSGMTNIVGPKIKLDVPCVWRNPRNFNFDKLQNAFLALFEVLSLEGWTEVRNILQERVGSYASLYLHVYVFLACLIGLTLFIGVVVSNFNENKGTALLTVDQRRWQDLKKRLKLSQPIHMPPRPEDNDKIGYIYDFFQTKLYRILYVSVVALNGLTLVTAEWYPFSFNAYESGNDKYLLTPFTATAIAFVYLFVIDLAVKIVCYGFLGYWLSWRNRFDFVLTVFGVLWSIFHIMAYWTKSVQPITLQTGVVLIIFRLFTLAGKIESIRMIILTLGMSLYKSFYTISVLFVIMWCYALIGVIMFGSTRFGIALNRHANFRNSWYALLLLFRITTGEDWNRVMHDCMVSPPLCSLNEGDNYWETDCGHSIVAPIFFFSYYVIVTYIFLNLFIAVVIENFSLFSSTDDDMFMSDSDIKVFQEVWNIIDKDHSGKLRASLAKRVLGLSIAKLKFNISADRFLYKRMCAEVDRISNGKEVSFHDLLLVLAYNDSRVKISRNLQLAERLAREDQVRAITEEVAAQTIRVWCLRMWRGKSQSRTNRANMLSSKQSVVSATSTFSADSDFSDLDELSASAASSLSVPRFSNEKRKVSKTGSYPLEHIQHRTFEHSNDLERSENAIKHDDSHIHDWWLNQISSSSCDKS